MVITDNRLDYRVIRDIDVRDNRVIHISYLQHFFFMMIAVSKLTI